MERERIRIPERPGPIANGISKARTLKKPRTLGVAVVGRGRVAAEFTEVFEIEAKLNVSIESLVAKEAA